MNIDKEENVKKAIDGFTNLMSAFGWNITQEKKTDNNNLDKDIEILRSFDDGYTFQQCLTCFKFNEKDGCCNREKCEELQAIENVLSELERLQRENNTLTTQNAMMSERHFTDSGKLKELETYKKIVEKLADELSKHIWLNDKDAILKIYREKVEEDETHS